MDQIMCDVTDIPGVRIGDEAVLLGRQGDACITADEIAGWADTISYEIFTCLRNRIPRLYEHVTDVLSAEDLAKLDPASIL